MDSFRHAKKLVKELLSWAITPLTAACSWALKVCAGGTGGTLIGGNVGGATIVVEGTAEVVAGRVVVTGAWVVVVVFVGGTIVVDWVVGGAAAVDGWVEVVGEGIVAVVDKTAVVAVAAGLPQAVSSERITKPTAVTYAAAWCCFTLHPHLGHIGK
jgi:hypothetical protein